MLLQLVHLFLLYACIFVGVPSRVGVDLGLLGTLRSYSNKRD